jgi:hypothetical protein
MNTNVLKITVLILSLIGSMVACEKDIDLTNLDVSAGTALTHLNVQNNQLTAPALNDLFGTLTDKLAGPDDSKAIYISNSPGTRDCDRRIGEERG